MFVPRISQGVSEVSFHISLRDFFSSPLALPQRQCWKSFKKIKASSFSSQDGGQGFGVGSPSLGAAQAPHESPGKCWWDIFGDQWEVVWKPTLPWIPLWLATETTVQTQGLGNLTKDIDPGFSSAIYGNGKQLTISNGNFLTRSVTHLPICLSASQSVSLLFFCFLFPFYALLF